jgi:hypothetical protein
MYENPTKTHPPLMLPPKTAAAALGISEHSLRAMIRNETVPHVRCGCKQLVNVTRLLERVRQTGKYTD